MCSELTLPSGLPPGSWLVRDSTQSCGAHPGGEGQNAKRGSGISKPDPGRLFFPLDTLELRNSSPQQPVSTFGKGVSLLDLYDRQMSYRVTNIYSIGQLRLSYTQKAAG